MKGQINDAAAELFGPVTAAENFSTTPGRLLRNRWVSIDEVEAVIIKGLDHIGPVFRAALAKSLRSDALLVKESAASRGFNAVILTEDEQFKLDQKTYRANSVSALACEAQPNKFRKC